VAASSLEATFQQLQLPSGVYPVYEPQNPEDWKDYVKGWMGGHRLEGNLVVLTEGPSSKHPEANHRMEIIDLSR
jgi:pyruvate kinase